MRDSKNIKFIGATFVATGNLGESLSQRIEQSCAFTNVPTVDPADVETISLVLFCIEEYTYREQPRQITHIGLLRKGQRVATNQVRISASNLIKLDKLTFDDLLKVIPKRFHQYLTNLFKEGYVKVGDKTGSELYKAILKLQPQREREINGLVDKLSNRRHRFKENRFQNAAGEKDALGLCLDIFGADRKEILQTWSPPDEKPKNNSSFLSGLKEFAAYEDDLLAHDLNTVPGYEVVSRSIAGIVEFKNNKGERLVVINANRKPLEKAFGIDLIYYHRKYNAFTFVQYKMMNVRVEDDKSTNYYYNPNQKSHHDELLRMQMLLSSLSKDDKSTLLNDFRLSNCPIFFKVCKRIQFKADDASIVPGAYIPLVQWEILLKDDCTKGPKGGRQIGFHTLGQRYIGTQTFVDLVQRGFLGTQSISSGKLGSFIETAIENGHTVMYAIDESKISFNDNGDIDDEMSILDN